MNYSKNISKQLQKDPRAWIPIAIPVSLSFALVGVKIYYDFYDNPVYFKKGLVYGRKTPPINIKENDIP